MKKTILLLIASLTCACAWAQTLSDWTLQRQGDPTVYKAQVPCTVAGILNENGVFGADVFNEDKYKAIDKSIFDDAWVFTTQFKAKKGMRYALRFEGLNYYADIDLNGKRIASSETTFGPYCTWEFEVSDIIKGKNTLKVTLRRAQKGDLNAGYVDWNPRPVDESMGIIRPVTLIGTTDVEVQDYVKMRFGPGKAHFNTVGITIDNFNSVTVEANSVNGWTLCFYNGTEGWIRSDFLFRSEADARAAYIAAGGVGIR